MKTIFIILICITLCGCASIPVSMVFNHPKIDIGMTKEQLYKIPQYTAPNLWSKQVINGKIYETWYYYRCSETFDFVDNVLVGYSSRSIYHSSNSTEDVRKYPIK